MSTPDQPAPDAMPDISELREAGEDGGDLMGYYCRGHVPAHLFAEAANRYSGASSSYDIRYVRIEDVRHLWYRTVPIAGEPGEFSFQPAEPGRGAWRATVADVVSRRELRRTLRQIQAENRGHANGFAAGVSWACHMLRFNFTDAEKHIAEAWTNGAADRSIEEGQL